MELDVLSCACAAYHEVGWLFRMEVRVRAGHYRTLGTEVDITFLFIFFSAYVEISEQITDW